MEEQKVPPSLVKIATRYGLIDGVAGFLIFVIWTMLGITQSWVSSAVSLVVLIVLMVLAHREYKKTHEGVMSYGQGLGSGTLLSVVAGVLAAILLFIYVSYINPSYPEVALRAQQAVLEQRGLTGAQLEQAIATTRTMLTPIGILVASLVSSVIFGFLCALIVSIFTKCDDPRAVV